MSLLPKGEPRNRKNPIRRSNASVANARFPRVSEFTNESITAIEKTFNEVDRALERLRLGTYRTCQVCSTPIDEADLEANPLLANCRAHPELA